MPCMSLRMFYYAYEVTTWEKMREMFVLSWQGENLSHKTEICQIFGPP